MAQKTSQQFTAGDVVSHRSKESLRLVIDGNVYDVTKFVDEHPGGHQVLIDQGGVDATEAFEEVGHSDEARTMLAELQIGTLKRQPGDESLLAASGNAYKSYNSKVSSQGKLGAATYILLLLVVATIFTGWHYMLG